MSALLRVQVVRAAESQVGNSEPRRYYLDTCGPNPWNWPKHWCQIFCLWCLHRAGLALSWKWVISDGFLGKLKTTRHPQPGDIAYFSKKQHGAVIEAVDAEAGTVSTIDGNAGWPTPKVKRKVRKLKSVTAFYSIASLFPNASDVHDTDPAPPPSEPPQPLKAHRRLLQFGAEGPDVAGWQAFLQGQIVSGRFDAYTVAATRVYQRQNGLTPDGIVGPLTRGKAGL